MARFRTIAVELTRLLDTAVQPVYVIDSSQTFVYGNRTCLEWLGQTAEDLQGQRCAYHTEPKPAEGQSAALGLCPPPAVFNGQPMPGIVSVGFADGRLSRRHARFLPLAGESDTAAAVLAVVDCAEVSEADAMAETADDEAARLHERVRSFRHQMTSRYRIDRLIGDSPAMQQVRAQVEMAAATRSTILVVGPPGSGRQHVASAIHYGGPVASLGSLARLECAVFEGDVIHATLAHLITRHSATGSDALRNTLVVSDADQMPIDAQAELVRIFRAKEFSFRVVATARQRLVDLVARQVFREDLALLLSTLVIELPPLARRRCDVPMLLQLFLEEANVQSSKQIAGFTPEALDLLNHYTWPGNVDELIQVVAEAHRNAGGIEIGVRDLPQHIPMAASAAAYPRRSEETIVLDEFLGRIERELVQRALARVKGNKSKAAKLLGMTRPRLYRRLVQLGLIEESEAKAAEGGAGDAGEPEGGDGAGDE
jgi:DNA-binding NtrC family response regulator